MGNCCSAGRKPKVDRSHAVVDSQIVWHSLSPSSSHASESSVICCQEEQSVQNFLDRVKQIDPVLQSHPAAPNRR